MHNPSAVEMEIADVNALLDHHPRREEIRERHKWEVAVDTFNNRELGDKEMFAKILQIRHELEG